MFVSLDRILANCVGTNGAKEPPDSDSDFHMEFGLCVNSLRPEKKPLYHHVKVFLIFLLVDCLRSGMYRYFHPHFNSSMGRPGLIGSK